jgi:formylglycine-generating enzyme required for sulfatase activity
MSDERAKRLAQLRQAYESGILDEDTYRAAVAALGAPAAAQAELPGSGAIAQGPGAVGGDLVGRDKVGGDKITVGDVGPGAAAAVGAGSMAIGQIYGNVYAGPPPQDAAEALCIYRRVVAQACGQLPLRGVDVGAADPTAGQKPLGLANVYVDLDTTARVDLIKTERKDTDRQAGLLWERDTRPLGVLEAAIINRRLALLGSPGGGKSTFVNHLAYCLASNALQPEAGWLKHLPGWPAAEAETLPVLVALRDLARGLPDPLPRRAEPSHLWSFIVGRLQAQNMAFAADPLHAALEQGRALVLLDGLDEVPSAAQRAFVRDAVAAFVGRYPASRYLATCRVLSYQPPATRDAPDLRLAGFPAFELAAFDEKKIDRFIGAWYAELARTGAVRSQDAAGLAGQLRAAVRRPDLRRLAPNPLLLTVMALVHTHKGRLPDTRAMLYEDTVDILLWRWEQVKAGGDETAPSLRRLLLEAGRADVDLKRAIWGMAFEAHRQGGGDDDREKLADIGEWKLEKALAALKGDDRNWARQVLEAMKLRAGLLLESAPEVFTFPHRTFQEYLAGAHLAAQADFARQACRLAEEGAAWREVILLAAGRLVYLSGDTDKPLALVGELCPAEVEDSEVGWRKAWLAGDVLLEIGANRVADSALGRDLLARVRKRLADLLAEGRLSPRERAAAGDSLARLGDPRFRADAWYLPDEPLLGFVEIPAGPFLMGTRQEDIPALLKQFGGDREWGADREWYEQETPQHEVDLPAYYIARYPVTHMQYYAFVQSTGRKPPAARIDADQPYEWRDGQPPAHLRNHPVALVNWYDAVAYCAWLTERLRAWEGTPEPLAEFLRRKGWQVRPQGEAEWEKAARGMDGRIFPWGDKADPNRANYADAGIGTTSAVGCFPSGASPFGVEDMSGNVWEWCATKWQNTYQDYRGDNRLLGAYSRVLRGGALGIVRYVRCASRSGVGPGYRVWSIGFRVCVAAQQD